MRYELTDHEWAAIRPLLPNKPRGVPRVNDRRVLNGIFWVLRSGAPWRDLPQAFGPYTTCYNRFVRWRRAGVWRRIMNALSAAHDASVQMIISKPLAAPECRPRRNSESVTLWHPGRPGFHTIAAQFGVARGTFDGSRRADRSRPQNNATGSGAAPASCRKIGPPLDRRRLVCRDEHCEG